MFRLIIKNKGQSTTEYAILIVVVILALIGMQAYLKRGVQGRMRDSTDQIGEQFSPEQTTYNFTTTTGANVTETTGPYETSSTYHQQWSQRTGSETVGNMQEEWYEVQ